MKEIVLDIQNEIIEGNVLDIGIENYGVVYNIIKKQNKDVSIGYIDGKKEKANIEKGCYNSCVLFFSLSNLWINKNKSNLIKNIYDYLDDNGNLYIWDMDKGYKKIFQKKINIVFSNSFTKSIIVKDFNIFKDSSRESIIKKINKYFKIDELRMFDDIYFIKAKKISFKDI